MRRQVIAVTIILLAWAANAYAQPGSGTVKTAPLSGSGSTADPLKINLCGSEEVLRSTGLTWACSSAMVDGAGTLNFVPLWTPDGNTLGNSYISQQIGTPGVVFINPGGAVLPTGTLAHTEQLHSLRLTTNDGAAGFIVADADKDWTIYPLGNGLGFAEYTSRLGGSVVGTHMWMAPGGNIGLGTVGSTDPVSRLDVRGAAVFQVPGGSTPVAPLNTAVNESGIEVNLPVNSLITLGDQGNAPLGNPAITLYRTTSGFRQGTAARFVLQSSNFDLRLQRGSDNTAYGSETYFDLLSFNNIGNATFYNDVTVNEDATVGGNLTVTGTFNSANDIYLTRALPTVVNDYVEIGYFTKNASGQNLDIAITVTDSGISISKRYLVTSHFNLTGLVWHIVTPISSTGPYVGQDFELDAIQTDSSQRLFLRIRRTAGTVVGTARVAILNRGDNGSIFTATSATGSTAAPTVYFPTTMVEQRAGATYVQNGCTYLEAAAQRCGNSFDDTNSALYLQFFNPALGVRVGDEVTRSFVNVGGYVNTMNGVTNGGYKIDGVSTLYRSDSDGHLYLLNPYSVGGVGAHDIVVRPTSSQGDIRLQAGTAGRDDLRVYDTAQVSINTTAANLDTNSKLHVTLNSGTGLDAVAGSVATFENNSTTFVTLKSGAEKGILFSNTISAADGGIIYDQASMLRGLQFRTGGNSTKMVIESGGDVGINVIDPQFGKLEVNGTIASATATGVNASLYLRQNAVAGWTVENPAGSSALRIWNESAIGTVADFGYVSGQSSFYYNMFVQRGFHVGSTAADSSDALYVGRFGKNILQRTDDLGVGALGCGADGQWTACNFGTVTTWTRVFSTSPRGVSEWVGQLQTDNTTNQSWYGNWIYDRSHGITDIRNRTFTFSLWAKAASGTPSLIMATYRGGGVDGVSTTCTTNASTWTRCTLTWTTSNASGGDNNDLLFYVLPNATTTAIYVWGAQAEENNVATPYVANRDGTFNTLRALGWNNDTANTFPLTRVAYTPNLVVGASPVAHNVNLGTFGVYSSADIANGRSQALVADTFEAGNLRKNALFNSDTLTSSGNGCGTGIGPWDECEYGTTLAWTTATQVSPRGVSESVGQVTCTGATCPGGSDFRAAVALAQTGVSDVRGQTWTASFWAKLSSGSPFTVTLTFRRHGDTDGGAINCVINAQSWTRCSMTWTWSFTSLADNSRMIMYVNAWRDGVATYVYGAQIEQTSPAVSFTEGATTYQKNDATLASAYTNTDRAAWTNELRIGRTMQNPRFIFTDAGGLTANGTTGNDGDVFAKISGVPQWTTISGAGGIDGSGTLDYLPLFTPDGNTLGNSKVFQALSGGQVVFHGNNGVYIGGNNTDTINVGLFNDADATLYINPQGYNVGSTRYRSLIIYNGRGSQMINLAASASPTLTITPPTTITGNLTVNGGTTSFSNATSNNILWNTMGIAAPSFTTRSAGTKLTLYPSLSGTQVDYALGIEGSTLWFSIPSAINTTQFKWYAGTTNVMQLQGDGHLTVNGALTATGEIILANTGASNVTIANSGTGQVTIGNTTSTALLQGTTTYLGIFNSGEVLLRGTKVNALGTFGVSGTDPTISSCGGGSVTGEAQSMQVTVGSAITVCTINFNRTFTAAPFCVFSAANNNASADVASVGGIADSPYITSTTTTVTLTFDANTEGSPVYNIWCPDRY